MRCLNTNTLLFEHVAESELGTEGHEYAILSHRWSVNDGDEVSFEDMANAVDVSHKHGYAKLKAFCDQARALGYRYAWIDTCCINKGSSVELSEAINSMYRWYQKSGICFAYLEDVPAKKMMDSEWFERGWTLQELIGPRSLTFFDRDWNSIGTKGGLLAELSSKTGIPEGVLSHSVSPGSCSIAQRMSWAAKRVTRRVEDRAYSLAGLFGVSLGQNYGEEDAFLRLQMALLEKSKDESIFAWTMDSSLTAKPYCGLFAPSPLAYADCREVMSTPGSSGFTVANGELSIELQTAPHSMETYYAVLNCTERTSSDTKITIFVRRTANDQEFVRVKEQAGVSKATIPVSRLSSCRKRLLRVPVIPTEPPLNRFYGYWLRTLEPPGHEQCSVTILSNTQTQEPEHIGLGERQCGTVGVAKFSPLDQQPEGGRFEIRWMKFGFDNDFNPILLVANRKSMYGKQRHLLGAGSLDASQSCSEQQALATSNGWISAQASVPNRHFGWPDGVSIIKGRRNEDTAGVVNGLNVRISIRLLPYCTPTIVSKETAANEAWASGPSMIWTVDITDTKAEPPAKSHLQARWCMGFAWVVGLGTCGYLDCCLKSESKKRDEARGKRTQLGLLPIPSTVRNGV